MKQKCVSADYFRWECLLLIAFREERNQTQVLRQQQDEAYQASLLADQAKEKKKREEQEQKRQEEEKARQSILAEERRLRVSHLIFCINSTRQLALYNVFSNLSS